ncbi:DUF481 domain-containing protein [Zobellia nedashkovskayae]|uniref:DUF481 domain-containing protein n=1 Tax=Zobellia nedashkovskayae TaxID=2779510 RepID=UPI00188B8AB8|nr:DUF481 domain-containing protein [Zobellia nedashkovskayae]
MKLLLFIGFTILFFHNANAQLVNIESQRMQKDSVRFALKSDLLFNYTDNNGAYILAIGSNITTQVKSKDLNKIFFFIGNYNLIRSKDEDFQNSYFFHLRYNHKITDFFRLESFIQNQNNTLLSIRNRSLVGAGVRLKLVSEDNAKLYFGNAYMYEIEIQKDTEEQFNNHRNSSYLSATYAFPKTRLDFTGTVYFQPLYRYIANHRVLSQLKAEMPLTGHLSISALYNYSYSSFSTTTESDRSSNLKLGLTFSL